MLALLLLGLPRTQPTFDFDIQSGSGLTVSVAGVPVIRGSGFQYYEPDWSRGYYTTVYNAQKIERPNPDTVRLTFKSSDGRAYGLQLAQREGDKLKVSYEFYWSGSKPVNVELTAAEFWAPAVQNGPLTVDGKPGRSLLRTVYKSRTDIDERRLAPDGRQYIFRPPLGEIDISTDRLWTLFDARGYAQEWAMRSDLLWCGQLAVPVSKSAPAKVEIEYRFAPYPRPNTAATKKEPKALAVSDALAPETKIEPLIPKPKEASLNYDTLTRLGGTATAGAPEDQQGLAHFQELLGRRWRIHSSDSLPGLRWDSTVVASSGINPAGYELRIVPGYVSVRARDTEGMEHAIRRLVAMAFWKDGSLCLPTGTLKDWPSTDWRGVHLFVGPNAPEFQKRLWDRVLLPLGFNKAVLQCERTEWKTLPNVRGGINMKREDLAKLCDWYRSVGVEPIPLVQSFGHAEWLFQGGKNLDIAFNPTVPYAVDPRFPKTREVLSNLWDEVVQVTKPKTVHFGLDEVDMKGWPDDPKLVTDLWRTQLPFLGGIARKHHVNMMLWGDQCLAPGDAPDATMGDSKEQADARRKAIPKGALIGDWHYKPDPDPAAFGPSLDIWKREGFRPIATTWSRPENVRSFDLAALQRGAGILQSTWAGYESNESNMLGAIEQFSAMVLAADYAWSGRQEMPDRLGYDPEEVFRQLMFGQPSVTSPEPGVQLSWGPVKGAKRIGQTSFALQEPLTLRSNIVPVSADAADAIELRVAAEGHEVALAIDVAAKCEEGDPVADIEVELANGQVVRQKLVYGRQVRAPADPAPVIFGDRADGLTCLRIDLGAPGTRIVALRAIPTSSYAGLRIHGVTVLDGAAR